MAKEKGEVKDKKPAAVTRTDTSKRVNDTKRHVSHNHTHNQNQNQTHSVVGTHTDLASLSGEEEKGQNAGHDETESEMAQVPDEAHEILKACSNLSLLTYEMGLAVRLKFGGIHALPWVKIAQEAAELASLWVTTVEQPGLYWRKRIELWSEEH